MLIYADRSIYFKMADQELEVFIPDYKEYRDLQADLAISDKEGKVPQQGWRVDCDGSYFSLVLGCSSQLITEWQQFKAQWKEVYHLSTKCSQRCNTVPIMYSMKHYLREMHVIPLL